MSLDILKSKKSDPHHLKPSFDIKTYKQTNWVGDFCTIHFNCLLQHKSPTQNLGGGNSDEFYFKEGTYNKSKMLEVVHSDVSQLDWRFSRYHHTVNYYPFRKNKLKYVSGYDPSKNKNETDLFEFDRVKDYFKR